MEWVMFDQVRNGVLLTLIRFAYRHMVPSRAGVPDGIPSIRDPEARCVGYAPRKRCSGDWDCYGDRHYLCAECAHYVHFAGDAEG